jgi:hypothetical protein
LSKGMDYWPGSGMLAGATGLEPAASCVTGRRCNQTELREVDFHQAFAEPVREPASRSGLRGAPGETTFGKIIEAVENAERSRAPIQKTEDRLAGNLVYLSPWARPCSPSSSPKLRSTISVIIVARACCIAAGTPLAILGAIGRAVEILQDDPPVIARDADRLHKRGQIVAIKTTSARI